MIISETRLVQYRLTIAVLALLSGLVVSRNCAALTDLAPDSSTTASAVGDFSTTSSPEAVTSPGEEQQATTVVEELLTSTPLRRPRVTTVPLHLSQLAAPHAVAEVRREIRENHRVTMDEAFTTSPVAEDEELWLDALYATTVMPPDEVGREGVRKALAAYGAMPEEFQRMSLEAAYGLDPQAFLAPVASIAELTTNSKHFAMASLYLCRGLPEGAGARRDALARLARKFPDWTSDPILTMLHFDLCRGAKPSEPLEGVTTASSSAAALAARSRPPLRTLLSNSFAPGWPVVYTFQRPERSWPGLTMVRRPDGRFHRNPDGTFFRISHLARSRTNLPGYITNGNTPQGIFSVYGLARSRIAAIGSTPNLRIYLPHETSPERWFHNPALRETSWSLEMYREMLPSGDNETSPSSGPSWRDYFPIYTAWHAGAAGRYDILAHGRTVDPSRGAGQPWFPNTPTSGCLCAKELWDEATGRVLISDQLALVHAWLQAAGVAVPRDGSQEFITLAGRGPAGYLVVIELDDKPQPVTLDEILTEVLDAERR